MDTFEPSKVALKSLPEDTSAATTSFPTYTRSHGAIDRDIDTELSNRFTMMVCGSFAMTVPSFPKD